MGFPNEGAAVLLRRLRRWRDRTVVIGVNIGKGADTPLDRAAEDYLALMEAFYEPADYLAINVSSPNTLGLRSLQAAEQLHALLEQLSSVRQERVAQGKRHVPMLVKLSPDLSASELERTLGVISETGMDGVIATNTTTDRAGLISQRRNETGGLSGSPLRQRSTELIRRIHQTTGGALPIVGVGGVFGPHDAREKLQSGAQLVQLYSGLVYRGPSLVRQILLELAEGERKSGFLEFQEAA